MSKEYGERRCRRKARGGISKERATKDAGSEGKQESWTSMRAVAIWWGVHMSPPDTMTGQDKMQG